MAYRTLMIVLGMLLVPSMALAQQDRGDRGGRGNFDPAQMRERFMNSIKERLGASDDEWKVLMPKVEKVQTAQRDSRGGFGFGGFGGGAGGGRGGRDGNNNQPQSPIALASSELNKVLENKDASADDISKRLTALREAREKARGDVTAAQKELKELVTQRQEAVLVTMGILE